MILHRIWQLLVVGVLLCNVGCTLLYQAVPTSVHLMLGNPSNATTDRSNSDNYLMIKPQYALSYNNSKHIPNWVSWQLNPNWLGNVPRRNDFRPDDSLPEGWVRVVSSDYNGSGFDRGHMAPARDRSRTPEDNSATFLMTNILPQAPDNNQGPWEKLESYCRSLVRQGKELYIVAGSYGKKRAIGRAKIIAPTNVWKVVVVLDQPGQSITAINQQTRVIAVDMPNLQGIKEEDWRSYRVSVDQIETATGYNLLSNLPETIQNSLESQIDRE